MIEDEIEGIGVGVGELDGAVLWMRLCVHMQVCWRLVTDFVSFLSDCEQRLKHYSSARSDISLT